MSAKTWGNCAGGLNCPYDRPPAKRGKRRAFKRGWRKLVRRRGKREAIHQAREAA